MQLFNRNELKAPQLLTEFTQLLQNAEPDLTAGLFTELKQTEKLASQRLNLSPSVTVVALVGATGSGKSSLFNAILGADIVTAGVRRPTTIHPTAAMPGGEGVTQLLDWLQISNRVQIPTGGKLPENVVLIDLPDIDSIATGGKEVVKFLAQRVDLLVWVADPQKYADNVLHTEFIKPLAKHANMTLGVLTHADTLTGNDAVEVLADFRRILEADAVTNPLVIATSAVTGQGIDTLRLRITDAAAIQAKATQKLISDLQTGKSRIAAEIFNAPAETVLTELGNYELPGFTAKQVKPQLTTAVYDVAGVSTVEKTVCAGYRYRAGSVAGFWPSRKLRVFKADPVKRLHLGSETGITSYKPLDMTLKNLEIATKRTTDQLAAQRPQVWQVSLKAKASQANEFLPLHLNHVVSRIDVPLPAGKAAWWRVFNGLQMLGWVLAIAGGAWLAAIHLLRSLLFIDVPTLPYYSVPASVWLLGGGIAWAILVSLITAGLIRWRAAAAGRKASALLRAELDEVVEEFLWAPLKLEDQRQRRILELLKL